VQGLLLPEGVAAGLSAAMTDSGHLLRQWAAAPAAAAWYNQGFRRTLVRLVDSGEEFTLAAQEGRVGVLAGFQPAARGRKTWLQRAGFDPGRWYAEQYVLSLDGGALRKMLLAAEGNWSAAETQYKVVASVLWVLIEALYAMPVMSSRLLLRLFGLDTFWQEALLDVDGRETLEMTVRFSNGRWQMQPGYHGRPRYRYRVTPGHILDEQRHILKAEQADSLAGWLALARWYKQYRAGVATRAPAEPSRREAPL
jgi:hypothetical protein